MTVKVGQAALGRGPASRSRPRCRGRMDSWRRVPHTERRPVAREWLPRRPRQGESIPPGHAHTGERQSVTTAAVPTADRSQSRPLQPTEVCRTVPERVCQAENGFHWVGVYR
jgi:hypothetical protein